MARVKFLCDADRCIECNACVTACKNENEVPWGINRRRVVTINDGKPGERSVSMACMHCTDAPCAAVCPVNLLLHHRRWRGAALAGPVHRLRLLLLRLSVRRAAISEGRQLRFARQDGQVHLSAPAGRRRTTRRPSTRSTAPTGSPQGKLPLCAEMCSTKSLLAGDGEIIAQIYKERVMKRGYGSGAWGWTDGLSRDHRDPEATAGAARMSGPQPCSKKKSLGDRGMAKVFAQFRFIVGALSLALLVIMAIAGRRAATQSGWVRQSDRKRRQASSSLLQAAAAGWSRSGRVDHSDQKSATLMQPAGRDWRQFHEVTLRWIGAISILGMLAILIVFYLTRGQVKLESGRSGRSIVRFNWLRALRPLDDGDVLHHPRAVGAEHHLRQVVAAAADRRERLRGLVAVGEVRAQLSQLPVHDRHVS